jgi:dTDP-L-rhamnose 4-epimerase
MLGEAYGVPTVALRLFNVYGTRQALTNPYTGALAVFASRLLGDRPPLVFEDGRQQRDFVSVYDVAQACSLALTSPAAVGRVFNIGSGRACTIEEVARRLAWTLGKQHLEPEISGEYRVGDVRHCFADITLARSVLGYVPLVNLEDGLQELAAWLEEQPAAERAVPAREELPARGLSV